MHAIGWWFVSVAVLSLVVAGCGSGGGAGGGCKSDNDCKGDRVCIRGKCRSPDRATRDTSVAPPGQQQQPPPPPQQQQPPPVQNSSAFGPDGLPVEIPAPGSSPPSLQEWNSVTREVTVRGSSALNCQTKMLREWLKVRCAQQGSVIPTRVTSSAASGVQGFTFTGRDFTDLVIQVVRGRESRAMFGWSNHMRRELVVNWPSGAPRPSIYFSDR